MFKCKLGWSEERVSRICLGTMTFGVQNSEVDMLSPSLPALLSSPVSSIILLPFALLSSLLM